MAICTWPPAADGSIVFAHYANGCIRCYGTQSPSIPLVRGLSYPVGLVAGPDGSYYVSLSDDMVAVDTNSIVEAPRRSILRIRPSGTREQVVRLDTGGITFFDVDEDGVLYVPTGDRLLAVSPGGTVPTVAQGFGVARAAAIAPDGLVCVSDYHTCALYHLIRR